MKRDDDYIRALLFEAETSDQPFILAPLMMAPDPDDLKRHMHAKWLGDAGFFEEGKPGVFRITNRGHDYLATIRDEGIWRKTKDAAEGLGGVTLGLMKDIALAYLKQEASERLGLTF
jgi:hypothetical protein